MFPIIPSVRRPALPSDERKPGNKCIDVTNIDSAEPKYFEYGETVAYRPRRQTADEWYAERIRMYASQPDSVTPWFNAAKVAALLALGLTLIDLFK
jgi:hypothetical protein